MALDPYCHLKYYFQRHVCVSIRPLVSPYVRACVRRLAPIPAGESQDVVPYVVGLTPGVPGAPEPRMYPRSGYFLVLNKMQNFIIFLAKSVSIRSNESYRSIEINFIHKI